MQERKWDGTDKLTDYEEMIKKARDVEGEALKRLMGNIEERKKAEYDSFKAAANDESNQFVAIHAPGSVIEMQDGTKYIVDRNGAWRKLAK
jgi:hypothetical protein